MSDEQRREDREEPVEDRDENTNPWYGHDPGLDPSVHTAQPQSGWETESKPAPEDLRDTYGDAGPSIGHAETEGAVDVEEPPTGPYPLPNVVERPYIAQTPSSLSGEPTRDPSLSRAVDIEAAGMDPRELGFEPAPRETGADALGPAVDELSPDAEPEPGGQWGSSG